MKTRTVLQVSLTVVVMLVGAVRAAGPTELDHYLCYKGALSKGQVKFKAPFPAKELKDRFADKTYDAKNPKWHCNPVAKTYNGVTEPVTHTGIHLEGYPIALTKMTPAQTKFTPRGAFTADQFGALHLVVKMPESVNVRTSKTVIGPYPFAACTPKKPCTAAGTTCQPATGGFCLPSFSPPTPPANDGAVDNFKCYKVALPKGTKFTPIVGKVKLQDQFWGPTDTFDIKKPTRLCTPVDKANENPGAESHSGHLVCYQVALTALPKGQTKPAFPKFKTALSNGNFADNQLDVTAVKELCVPAMAAVCGDGVPEQPIEECDAPGNTTQCPGGGTCNSACRCPVVTGCFDYHAAGAFLDICQSVLGMPCSAPAPVPAVPDVPTDQTTFKLCTGAADSAGRRPLTVDPATWFADASFTPAGGSVPISVTTRLCPSLPMTGVLFTTADPGSFPGTVCLTGDPAKLLTTCSAAGDCDGPSPTAGNGVCGTRDVGYTSQTTNAGTAFSYGDGIADPAGSALIAQDLRVDVWFGDATCIGNGVDLSCSSCDYDPGTGTGTPAPAGRIGIDLNLTGGGSPNIILPLVTRFTTGSAENNVAQTGNTIDGREVLGSGLPSQGVSIQVVGGNASLGIPTFIGPAHVQFFAKQVFAPVLP